MKDLIIEKTDLTPAIHFNAGTGILNITGRAHSTSINKFYSEINLWIDEYLKHPNPTTTLALHLEYYNSAFYKLLFILIDKCKRRLINDKKFIIKWYHHEDEEDSVDDAKEISTIINFPIELITVD